jgi:hypothetical protein
LLDSVAAQTRQDTVACQKSWASLSVLCITQYNNKPLSATLSFSLQAEARLAESLYSLHTIS